MAQTLERQRIVRDFVSAGAVRPETAIDYRPYHPRMFRQLRAFGAIVDHGAGRFHLDAERLTEFRAVLRWRAAAAAGSGVMASVAALARAFAQ